MGDVRAAMKKAIPSVTFDGGDGKLEAVSTGSLALDAALGIWGFPKGRIVEVFGNESSGKTALAFSAIRQHQLLGKLGAYIETEGVWDAEYASRLGVDVEKLIHPEAGDGEAPLTGEEYTDLALIAAEDPSVGIVVVDSVAACVPKDELEGDMSDMQVGLQARMFGKFMRKVTGLLKASGNTLLLVNQVRDKVGGYGNPEVTPAGKAIKFYSSQRLSVRRAEVVKTRGEPSGINVKARVIKNKCAPPLKEAEFVIKYGVGVDAYHEALALGHKAALVTKTGNWYSFEDERLGLGFDTSAEYLARNGELFSRLQAKVREHVLAHPEVIDA